MLIFLWFIFNNFTSAHACKSIDEMVASCERSLGLLERVATRQERFLAGAVLTDEEKNYVPGTVDSEEFGAYGEFPARKFAEILHHPSVKAVIKNASGKGANFVDLGSGAGRICLAVSSMYNWASVTGIEALELPYKVAYKALKVCEKGNAVPAGMVNLFHSNGSPLHEKPVADMLSQADVLFTYCTAFSDDLTLPLLSASLASTMREGSLAITTDKWLIGKRFHFVDLMSVEGETGEMLQTHIWRLVGDPPAGGYDEAIAEIQENWMHEAEDLCSFEQQGYDRACDVLTNALENLPADYMEALKEVESEEEERERENEERQRREPFYYSDDEL